LQRLHRGPALLQHFYRNAGLNYPAAVPERFPFVGLVNPCPLAVLAEDRSALLPFLVTD